MTPSDLDFSRPCAREGCGQYLPASASPRRKYHAPRCQVADSRARTAATQPPRPVRVKQDQSPEARKARKDQQRRDRRVRTHANGGIAPTKVHNASTWNNWGCRCTTCVTAHLAKIHGD
jgi:hypothetical protein